MAVKARTYLQQGGMNRKKAGEDFYFLQKLMLNAEVTELIETVVYPSARPSHRVPFGTGRAIQQVLDGSQQTSYPFQAFRDLSALIKEIDHMESIPKQFLSTLSDRLPNSINHFLQLNKVDEASDEIARNVRELHQFKRRFWQWFNGFRCMKFLNWVSEETYPRIEIGVAASEPQLLNRIAYPKNAAPDVLTLLTHYRSKQRSVRRHFSE